MPYICNQFSSTMSQSEQAAADARKTEGNCTALLIPRPQGRSLSHSLGLFAACQKNVVEEKRRKEMNVMFENGKACQRRYNAS